jgi:hypothetical protein
MNEDVMATRARFTRDQWFSLPLKLRVRWWEETNYGKQMPSDALMAEIESTLR